MSQLPILPAKFISPSKHTHQNTSCYYDWNVTVYPLKKDTLESLTEVLGERQKNKVSLFIEQGLRAECFLKMCYRAMTLNELSTYLDCDKNVIVRRAKKLKLGSRNDFRVTGKPYQQESKTIVELLKNGWCNKCIAEKLNRTASGIAKKIQRMKREGTLNREQTQQNCNKCK